MNAPVYSFSRRPLFWILLTIIFVTGGAFSLKYFSRAFPIVNLDITMNRAQALEAAQKRAQQLNWGPEGHQQAVMFSTDTETQTFIELEGGGKKAFAAIIEEQYYSPYVWFVRHFKEGEVNETNIFFTPQGKPYGFSEKLSDNAPGKALTTKEAQEIAVSSAQKDWNTDFSLYTLAETSQKKRPSGRIDHIFSYERIDKKVGEAPYRLKLVVSGDKLTKYNLFIKVPEAFQRRYEQMRSANNLIARMAGIAMLILYAFGGCIIGLFFLLRRRWIIPKPAILWALFISFLQLMNGLNSLPFIWMSYSTQLTRITFLTQFLIGIIMQFFTSIGILSLLFMAAESLGRKAFPEHIQLWKLWSKESLSSIQTIGRTLGGYLVLGFDFAFVIGFYYFAFRYLGWWTPSETLINPNILAYYAPWLSSAFNALQAGFLEECLFRAIPLSCAALIGQKWGNKKGWLIAGFIVQAIIFSAAHANYPAQPAYARLVELLIPSTVFGFIYLYFGLLPGIVAHFVYDIVWMALPLFLATAPGILINQILVILCALFPLLFVGTALIFSRKWHELPRSLYNAAWQPPVPSEKKIVHKKEPLITSTFDSIKLIVAFGIIGLIAWISTTPFKQDGLVLAASKQQAIQASQQELKTRNITLEKPWQQLVTINGSIDSQHRFVWQMAGKELYHKLLGTYLAPMQWRVRFAQLNGTDVVERAEEYNFLISPHGTVSRFFHILPQSRPGKSLSEQEARTIAHEVLKKEYTLDPNAIYEVSAISTKQPARVDWLFTFSNPTIYPVAEKKEYQGEARIAIAIAGDEVVDHTPFIFVPEKWQREQDQKNAILGIITAICSLLLAFFSIAANLNALLLWSRHQFARKTFFLFFGIIATISTIQTINAWPSIIAQLKTSEPFWHQLLSLISSFVSQTIFKSAFSALSAGFIAQAYFFRHALIARQTKFMIGTFLGTFLAGILSICQYMSPLLKPLWAEYTPAASFIPSLGASLTTLSSYISLTIMLYLVFYAIDFFTESWNKQRIIGLLYFLFIGIIIQGASGVEHIGAWLITGTIFGIALLFAYVFSLRYHKGLIPVVTATLIIVNNIQQMAFMAYPGALLGGIFSIVIICIIAYWWSEQLESHT